MTFLVVGGGKMGMSHLAVLTQYLGKDRVALVERKWSIRLLFKMMGYNVYGSVDKAKWWSGKPDGIVIATPTSSHAPLVEWAIANRVPFFVEKPLTLDAKRSATLLAEARKARVPAQSGFVMRYTASFQKLRALVFDERLGQVKGYEATMRGNVITAPPKSVSWQGDFSRGGGCLNEYGPHLIDLCRFIFGPVTDVKTAEKGHVHSTNADDWIELTWSHADATIGGLSINWCDTTKRKSVIQFRVEFEEAEVRADNSSINVTWRSGARLDPSARSEIEAWNGPHNVGFYLRGEEFSLEMEDFISTCLGESFHIDPNVPDDITPGLDDGYEVDRLIDEISRKTGLK